jgi:hypothetical protein
MEPAGGAPRTPGPPRYQVQVRRTGTRYSMCQVPRYPDARYPGTQVPRIARITAHAHSVRRDTFKVEDLKTNKKRQMVEVTESCRYVEAYKRKEGVAKYAVVANRRLLKFLCEAPLMDWTQTLANILNPPDPKIHWSNATNTTCYGFIFRSCHKSKARVRVSKEDILVKYRHPVPETHPETYVKLGSTVLN